MAASQIVSQANNIMPKGNTILFNSFPDLSGNALALYEYIVKNRLDIQKRYHLVWAVASISVLEAQKMLSIILTLLLLAMIGKENLIF